MTEAYIADTNVVSMLWDEVHPGHDAAREFARELPNATIYISVITLAEVEYGLRTVPNIDKERQTMIRRHMAEFPLVLEITKHTVEHYSELRAELFKRYSPRNRRGRLKARVPEDLVDRTTGKELGIQENDLWIAALALERNLILLSYDKMDRIRAVAPELRFVWLKSKSQT